MKNINRIGAPIISKLWKISFFLSVLTGGARALSKATLDFAVVVENKLQFHHETTNDKLGIEKFIKQLKIQCPDANFANSLYCMEHTGIYNNPLLNLLHSKQAKLWLEHPIHIKDSLGMIRGKNDKIDAQRIAVYARAASATKIAMKYVYGCLNVI